MENYKKEYTLKDDFEKRIKNPEFKKAWEESEIEHLLSVSIIKTRLKEKLSQRALAKKVGTSQSVIARIEGMDANPSLKLLKRIAKALDTKLKISFT